MATTRVPVLLAAGLVIGGAAGVVAEGAGLSPVPEPEPAPPAEARAEVLGPATRVFDCPDGSPIAVLAGGELVLATGRTDDGRWIEIRSPLEAAGEAWMPVGVLDADGDLEDLPERACGDEGDEGGAVPGAEGAAATASGTPGATTTPAPGSTSTSIPGSSGTPARTNARPPTDAPSGGSPSGGSPSGGSPSGGSPSGGPPSGGPPSGSPPSGGSPTTTEPSPGGPTDPPPTTAPDQPPNLGDPASSQQVMSTTSTNGDACPPFLLPETAEISVAASDDGGAPVVTMAYRTIAGGEVVSSGAISVGDPVDGVYRGILGPLPPAAAGDLVDTFVEVTIVAVDSAGQQATRVFTAATLVRCLL